MIASLLCLQLAVSAGDLTIDPKAKAAIDRLDKAWAGVKTATYKMKKHERMRNDKESREENLVKFRKPADVYINCIKPCTGQEVIYAPGKNEKQLRVHPGRFPDLTLWLDVHGDLVMNNQHHPIYHMDIGYGIDITRRTFKAVETDAQGEKCEYGGAVTRNGRTGDLVRLIAGNRAPKMVEAKKGETFLTMGRRIGADAYMMYVANPEVSSVNSKLGGGKLYRVPAYYAEKTEMVIDVETGYLLDLTLWNGDGEIYEHYEYLDFVANPPLTDLDFDEKNPAYKF